MCFPWDSSQRKNCFAVIIGGSGDGDNGGDCGGGYELCFTINKMKSILEFILIIK